MVISDDSYAMLLTETKFKEFTHKEIADATKRPKYRIVDTALMAGATEARELMEYGFMSGRNFNDLDGHIWEITWMDPSHVQK
jgi:predicted lactoylglutathione lyase